MWSHLNNINFDKLPTEIQWDIYQSKSDKITYWEVVFCNSSENL